MKHILLSVKRPYSEKILSKEKGWELRKNAPRLMRGDSVTLWLYESGKDGRRAIIGKCRVVCIVPLRHMPFGDALSMMIEDACVSEEYLRDYMPCCAWGLQEPVRIEEVALSAIGLKRPPQSWRYLRDDQVAMLEGGGR